MNQENIQYENKEICAKCGGYCCKRGGCDYSINDFESLKIDYLQEKLEEGYISIVAYHNFVKLSNGRLVNEPFLFLRARNINRPIVDLISLRTKCMGLTSNGCMYDVNNRPTGGVNYIPKENDECYQLIPAIKIVSSWKDYQRILTRLVKRITGKSIDECLKEAVEKYFYDMLNENYEGIMEDEIINMEEVYPSFVKVYPLEHKKTLERYKKNNILKLKK